MRPWPLLALLLVAAPHSAGAATLTVGPGKMYPRPCAAIAAAKAGDLIEVDAGRYDGDTCAWSTDGLTVRGVGGRASIDLTGVAPAQRKGIFTIAAPTATIENFELSGAAISPSDGNNGAGIRHQGLSLTVRNCFFHDNQNGILGSPSAAGMGEVLIEGSEFADNGAGDGFSHNMYLGNYARFTLRASWTHGASEGHLVKSRARQNFLVANRITDEPGSTASYEIDLPNAGSSFVLGNLIEQGRGTHNPTVIAYGEEGVGGGYDTQLYVVGNTILNNKGSGTFVNDATATPAVIANNIFWNGGAVSSQPSAILTANFEAPRQGDPKFVDVAGFDVHLQPGSPCIDKGVDPGRGGGLSLLTLEQYLHPRAAEARFIVGSGIDIGAFEFGNAPPAADLGTAPPDLPTGAPADGGAPVGAIDLAIGPPLPTTPDAGCSCRLGTHDNSDAGPQILVALLLAALLCRPMRKIPSALLALALCSSSLALAAEGPPPLIPRDVLFGNPERTLPKISPDGKRLAWLAPDKNGVLQVWVKTIGGKDDKVVTADKKRGIRRYDWAEDDRTLLYQQDADGDENWHVYGVDLASGIVRDYTPWQGGVRAELLDVNPEFPGRMLVTANVRDRRVFDVYRVDLKSGATELDTENPGDIAEWTVDPKQVVRAADVLLPNGGHEVRVRDTGNAAWRTLFKTGPEEEVSIIDFSTYGKSLYLLSSLGSDVVRVVERNLDGGGDKEVAPRRDGVDTQELIVHPRRHVIQAVGMARGRLEYLPVDQSIRPDLDGIARLAPGDFRLINRDRADETWLVGITQDKGPVRFYSWDRKAKKGTFLFVHQPKLDGLALSEMKFVTIKARDGLELPAYLTLPRGTTGKNLPAVLLVHGGPWARDQWGFNSSVQWLANRGYAVLQINFRGSTGFGKKFLHAADKQWGKTMHNDLIDGVKWLVAEGVADPKRVAIFGGSYGGYSALAGAAFTPDVFRCAVDIVGPSSLFTLLKSIPPYWAPMIGLFHARMGEPERDKELLTAASPLFSADKIKIPLLIAQGANDPRVKQAESEQIVAAIEKNGGSATYVLYPDEGHGFARPENRIDFNARAEQFLAAELGGRAEPQSGDRVPGSTAVVKVVGKAAPAAR